MDVQDRGGWSGRIRALLGGGPCAVCRTWQMQAICPACCEHHAAAVTRCVRCGEEVSPGRGRMGECGVCRLHPPPFLRTVVALPYAFPWDGLLTRLKFHQALELAPALAELLGDAVGHALVLEPGLRPDLVLPVPLSDVRQSERGYNQAWELARRVARRWALPARPDGLYRVRSTLPQSDLPREERWLNVRGAFAAQPGAPIRGRRIAVVDDVMTTGATLSAAADALVRAGATEVQLWVAARTPKD